MFHPFPLRWLTFTAAGLLIGAVAVLGVSRLSAPDTTASSTSTPAVQAPHDLARLTQLEADMASLRARLTGSQSSATPSEMQRRLAALQSEVDALKGAVAASGSASQPDDPVSDDQAEPDTEAAERERTQRFVAFFEQQLSRETMDPGWSATAQRDISQSLADPALNDTHLGEVQCQSTLCRIHADHASRTAERSFVSQLGRLDAFRDAEAYIERFEHDDGGITTTIFVSRAGHRLPDAAQAR